MNLLFVMVQRMGSAFAALAHPALEQMFRVFDDQDLQGRRSQIWKRSTLLW